jgi:KDO2-lipid IV(A) lauroyltransferase
LAQALSSLYGRLHVRRRRIVLENLLPATGGDLVAASRVTSELFRQFGRKLADLWRYEAGLPIEHLVSDWKGWENLEAAQARKRGLLLLTPHLGNWELGAPFLAQRGIKLLVITQQEPAAGLTEHRQSSRARWGIETLVIGEDAFAFLEVIRRLEAGAAVALLVDRPALSSATRVQLFGRPFLASKAAAELARATGCSLMPVVVIRQTRGYQAQALPEIIYDRKALGSRPARDELTQQVISVFEPLIRQHLAQWYHFVPIWPK